MDKHMDKDKQWKIFGAEMSPYSVKVRSYFRCKGLPHIWLQRAAHQEEFAQHAKLPIVPLVVAPNGEALQDSTPIMDALEARQSEPSCVPSDPLLAFVSVLLEEYADEWGNKLMFHFRWWDEVDRRAAARALALSMTADKAQWDAAATMIYDRMTQRGHFVGSSKETAPLLDGYFDDATRLWEAHFAAHPFVLGARPSFADFGVYAQFYELYLDPGTGGRLRGFFPHILDHCHRMLWPRAEGKFAAWTELAPTLEPVVRNVGQFFLPWSAANAKALEAGEDNFAVELDGQTYQQPPQKYHAKSLRVLREKYRAVRTDALDALMQTTGCLAYLEA